MFCYIPIAHTTKKKYNSQKLNPNPSVKALLPAKKNKETKN